MAVAFVQATDLADPSTWATLPAGTSSGTITPAVQYSITHASSTLVAAVYGDAGGNTSVTINTPTGWNLVGTSYDSSNVLRLSIFQATGLAIYNQPFSVSVGSSPNPSYFAAILAEFSGTNVSAPVDPNSGFMTETGYGSANTGTIVNGPYLAPQLPNTLAFAVFAANDNYISLEGSQTGWTEHCKNQSEGSNYASIEGQTYNSTPVVGTPIQSGVNIAGPFGNPGPWLQGYLMFIVPAGENVQVPFQPSYARAPIMAQ